MHEFFADLRRRVWNKRIKLWWYRLYVRRNEFHKSLDSDFDALAVMSRKEAKAYFVDLSRRRRIAHKRDLAHT